MRYDSKEPSNPGTSSRGEVPPRIQITPEQRGGRRGAQPVISRSEVEATRARGVEQDGRGRLKGPPVMFEHDRKPSPEEREQVETYREIPFLTSRGPWPHRDDVTSPGIDRLMIEWERERRTPRASDEAGELGTKVFDAVLMGSTTQTTSPRFDHFLGAGDELALVAIVDQVTGTSTAITIAIDHSGDRSWWIAKGSVPEVDAVALNDAATNTIVGFEPGTVPSLSYVRLRLQLSGTGPLSARVSGYVCSRRTATRDPAPEEEGA
jgi:hypothetical protein